MSGARHRLSLLERTINYSKRFPKRPPLQLVWEGTGRDRVQVAYGQWVIGQQYTNDTRYYGAYPRGYVQRVMALFPGTPESDVLHLFSGSLPAGPYSRCDLVQPAEYRCDAYDLPGRLEGRQFRLVLSDPPYSAEDARRYGTAMVNRGRVFREVLATIVPAGGHVVWLDCVWPMHRKDQWRTVGRIGLTRSTNHRVRMVSIFERRT